MIPNFRKYLLPLLVCSPTAWGMSLQEAVNLAIASNPITKTLEVDARIGEARLQQVRGDLHPQIGISFEKGTYETSNDDGNNDQGWTGNHKSKLELRQLVYDFHQTGYRIDSAAATVRAREFSYQEGEQRLALLVARAYLEILRLDEMLTLLDENTTVYKKLLDTMKQREAAGASSYSEVKQVAALLEATKKDRISYVADREFAVEAFTLAVGQPPEDLNASGFTKLVVNVEEDALLERAQSIYYGLLVKNEEVDAARATLNSSRRDLYPTLTLEGSWTRQESLQTRDKEAIENKVWVEEAQVKFVLTYDLWDGSKARSKKAESSLLLNRSEYQRDEYIKNLKKDIRAEWSNMKRFGAERESNAEYLKVSKEVVGLYRKEFELGQKSLLDISTAQRDHHRAKMDDVRISYDYYNSVLSLLLYQNAVIKKIQQL